MDQPAAREGQVGQPASRISVCFVRKRPTSPSQARKGCGSPRPSKVSQCGWPCPIINSHGLLPLRSARRLRMKRRAPSTQISSKAANRDFLIGVKNPLRIRSTTTGRPRCSFLDRAVAGFAISVGLRPSCIVNPATLSHLDWRGRSRLPDGREGRRYQQLVFLPDRPHPGLWRPLAPGLTGCLTDARAR
jgi:hypothetical protein